MADADTTRSQLAFRDETAFDEAIPTPTNPMQLVRVTKYAVTHKNGTVISDELRSDRGRSDLIKTGEEAGCSFSFEFSGDTFDKFLEGALGGVFASGVLKSGVIKRSFQFEDQALDIGQFIYVKGMSPGDLSLSVTAGDKITGDINFMGTVGDIFSATKASSLVARTTTPIMAAGPGVTNLLLNSLALSVGIKAIKLDVKNNLRDRKVVDSMRSRQHGRGDLDITGTLNAYFSNSSLWSLFRSNASLSLAWTLTDGVPTTGKRYEFLLPRVKFGEDATDVPGTNADRMEDVGWRALHDDTLGCQLQITKTTNP